MVEASPKKRGGCCGGGGGSTDASKSAAAGDGKGVRMSTAGKKAPGRAAGRPKRLDRNIEAKIILLGESGVGKSSIALRYCVDRFDEI